MTDSAPGPGWWLASDGNWYPPHLHPDVREPEPEVNLGSEERGDEQVKHATVFDPAWFEDPETDVTTPRASGEPDDAIADETTSPGSADAGDKIDWEAVAAERAARRAAAQKSPNGKRTAIAAIVALLALGAIAAFAQNSNNGDGGRSSSAPSTSLALPTTVAEVTGPTGGVDSGASGESGASGAPGPTSVFDLAPGACIDQSDLTEGLVTAVQEVPCDQPHTHEVYLTTSVVPSDVDYDAAAVTAYANQQCTAGFDEYVGIAYDASKFYFLHLAPSEESWNKEGDRDVVCLLLLDGEKLTASVKGSAE